VYPGAPAGLLFKGDPQLPPNVVNSQWLHVAPRFSFAYDVSGNGKTAIRGGYGVFYDDIASIRLNRFPLVQPFVLDLTVLDVNLADPFNGASPYPFTPPSSADQKKGFKFILPGAATSFNQSFSTPYSQQWNFNIQKQIPFDTVITAAYVGSKTSHTYGSHNINSAVYAPGATVATTQQRRLYPNFGIITEESTLGYSQYHSFQLTVNKRFSHGFTWLASYTFSKNSGLTSSQGEGSAGTRDPNNWRLDNGVLSTDRPQALALSSVWEIPSGHTKGFLKQVVGGWELTGIYTAVSGAPLTVTGGVDRSLNGQGLDTADVIGEWRFNQSRPRGQEVQQWFRTGAFALPATGTVGTSGKARFGADGNGRRRLAPECWSRVFSRAGRRVIITMVTQQVNLA
jgi:hypothetical protein